MCTKCVSKCKLGIWKFNHVSLSLQTRACLFVGNTLEPAKTSSDLRKWSTGFRAPRVECVFADAFTDFTVNRALLAAGTLLLRNAIVCECLLRCHGRTAGQRAVSWQMELQQGSIMTQSTRLWCGLAEEEDVRVLGERNQEYAPYSVH